MERFRSQNDIELHVEEIARCTRIEIGNSGYNLAGFDQFKSEILAKLRRIKKNTCRVKHKDLEDMVFRMGLTYDEIVDTLDIKYIVGSANRYTLPPGIYEISDLNSMPKSLLPNEVKVKHYN